MAGFAIVAVGMLLAASGSNYGLTLLGLGVLGGGVGMIGPNLFSTAAAAAPPERRSQFIGFTRAGFYAGPLVAQLLLEPVARSMGPGATLTALAAYSAAMVAVVLMARAMFRPVAATA